MAPKDSYVVLLEPLGVTLLEGVAFLEKMYHCGNGLSDLLCAQAIPTVLYSSHPTACESRCRTLNSFSSTMSACMPLCPAMMIMDETSEPGKQPQLNVFLSSSHAHILQSNQEISIFSSLGGPYILPLGPPCYLAT